jgi:hypothetical protein
MSARPDLRTPHPSDVGALLAAPSTESFEFAVEFDRHSERSEESLGCTFFAPAAHGLGEIRCEEQSQYLALPKS